MDRHVAPLGHIILIPSQPVFALTSKGDNSSHYMGDNSTSQLLNDQVSVASLQTNNQETDRLNEDQSVEPQLDNTDDCLTVLSNTVSTCLFIITIL
jgi:predicted metal-dependent peptidase